jgi:transposase
VIGTSRAVRVWAYPHPADLRKGYNGLYGLVKEGLGRDPLSGDLFPFVNRRRTTCKVLLWDGTACASSRSAWSGGASRACGASATMSVSARRGPC